MPKGRKTRYQEFLLTLKEVTGMNTRDLANACGKTPSNMSQYLSGNKQPKRTAIRRAVERLSRWNVVPHAEVELLPKKLASVPSEPGVYALYDSSASVVYVGQGQNLRIELRQTLSRETNFPVRSGPVLSAKHKPRYGEISEYYSAYIVPSEILRHNLEALLLRMFPNQSHNNKLGKFR